jgi:hypothetical protein
MYGGPREMADGTGVLGRIAPDRPEAAIDQEPPCPPPVTLGVPGFLAPRSLGEVKELARMIALAEWAPDCYRDIDGNYLQPKIELAILHGAAVGLGPIAAVHAIALIGGTPSIWGDGALSVIEHSGLLEDMVEDYELGDEEGLTAICTMKRRDRATPIVTRFSLAMAERAGLTRSEGPWQTYPERMLRMRARSWTMRDGFADVLRGLQLREEVDDYVASRGGRSLRSSLGEQRPQSRPRAERRPTTASVSPSGGDSQDRLIAEPLPSQETCAGALRAGFEQMVFDKHLSPDQIAGVWESNVPARRAIERLLGPEALTQAQEYLQSAGGVRQRPNGANPPEPVAPTLHTVASRQRPRQGSPSGPDRTLALEINPTWGIQKIFQHYRAALTALDEGPARGKPAIARFRKANIDVEQRLRAKLPSRMRLIDTMYQRAGLER